MNPIVLQTGTPLPKALQAELDTLGASYTEGLCHDPDAESQTRFHFFRPAQTQTRVCTVLFHGTGNDALFCWENLILDLLKSGRAVLTFDLPGHGRSSTTILNESTFARTGTFLPKLLARLCPECSEREAIGYSLGALAALRLVARDPKPWRALVLMALPERVSLTSLFMVIEALSFLQKGWWQQFRRYGWDASFPAFASVRRKRFPIRLDPSLRMSYPEFVERLLHKTDGRAELQAIQVPTLLLYGTRDQLARAAYGQELSASCQLVSGANHFLLPLAASTIILRWLTSPPHPAAHSVPR
ncbi:alpha/beta fold hydrolase [Oligoflexus tunisiensis]|uniref:alpha/beta fold hydrolase n=1 Tax=Oligoflexus tunisiensis TaxID=708132 RepID=UPI00159F00F9|nr:alpha/beta fold hydrolase [Oligoflexus tunisiensis]